MMRNSRLDEPEELLEPLPGICYGHKQLLNNAVLIPILTCYTRCSFKCQVNKLYLTVSERPGT